MNNPLLEYTDVTSLNSLIKQCYREQLNVTALKLYNNLYMYIAICYYKMNVLEEI